MTTTVKHKKDGGEYIYQGKKTRRILGLFKVSVHVARCSKCGHEMWLCECKPKKKKRRG